MAPGALVGAGRLLTPTEREMRLSDLSVEERRAYIQRAQTDPAWWISTFLQQDLLDRQREMCEAVRDHNQVAVKSCHASGKTHLAGSLALWFTHTRKDSLCLMTAPTFRQVQENAFQELTKAYAGAVEGAVGGDLLKTGRLKIGPRWGVISFATDRPINFSGFHAADVLIIVDEASGVEQGMFDALEGLKSSGRVKILLLSQGTQTAGAFYDAFERDKRFWCGITISAFDTPNFQPDVLSEWLGREFRFESDQPTEMGQQLLDAWRQYQPPENYSWPKSYLVNPWWACALADKNDGVTSDAYRVRVLGQFPSGDPHALIALHYFEAALKRNPARVQPADVWMGLDVARYGEDDSVLFVRREGTVLLAEERHGHNTVEVAQWAAEVAQRTGTTDVNVDVIGVGAGVADQLRAILPGVRVHDINVGSSARNKEQFLNQRAEQLWGLKERFQSGEISLINLDRPMAERLSPELTGIKWTTTPAGKVQIESKDDYKKRLGRSPDAADALMLAFAHPDDSVLIFSGNESTWDPFFDDAD